MKRLILISALISITMSHCRGGGNVFGATLGGSLIGTAVGSTIGTAVGNTISRPRSSSQTVVIKEVERVRPQPQARMQSNNRPARSKNLREKYQDELDDLLAQQKSLKRRIVALEKELTDVETAIDAQRETLKSFDSKRTGRQEITEVD